MNDPESNRESPTDTAEPRPHPQPNRRRQFRLKTLMLVVAVAGIWIWLLRSPAIAGLVTVAIGGLLAGALALATAMFLGWAGFQILASCDQLIHSAIAARRKNPPRDDWLG